MDPLTIALMAAPTVLSMFDRPSAPSIPQISLPNREPWARELLTNAYRTDTTMMDLARKRLMADINDQLAARGLGGTSMGMSMQSNGLANLMNQWMENQVQRQSQAYGAVTGADMGNANVQQNNANLAMQKYQMDLAGNRGKWGDIQNLANLGLSAYGMHQADSRWEQGQAMADKRWNDYLNTIGRSAPTGGTVVAPPPIGAYYSGYGSYA